jgi:hypothetical protein
VWKFIIFIKRQRHLKYYSEIPTFYQKYLAMKNTADVKGGRPTAVDPSVAIYNIPGRKGQMLFYSSSTDTTLDKKNIAYEHNNNTLMTIQQIGTSNILGHLTSLP